MLSVRNRRMNTLAINTVGDELEVSAEFCRAEGLGLEVSAFAFPKNIDGNMGDLVERHRQALSGIVPALSHGPFLDLVATSLDSAILDVTRQRHQVALDAAIKIGATVYVAHTNYTPMIRNPSYRKNWTRRMLDFWLPFADKAGGHGITICLENLWEPDPGVQANLVETGNHPHLRASFDNGHALVFSRVPAASWVETMGERLAHCHLHDNSGEHDQHKPVGSGKEDWQSLLTALDRFSPKAILVAESDHLDRNKLSIEKLKSF
jgi:sugar phosphate isomerase/epimerase